MAAYERRADYYDGEYFSDVSSGTVDSDDDANYDFGSDNEGGCKKGGASEGGLPTTAEQKR